MLQGKVGSKCCLYCPFITFVFPAHRPVIAFSAPTGNACGGPRGLKGESRMAPKWVPLPRGDLRGRVRPGSSDATRPQAK
jgi:hypothetical protein